MVQFKSISDNATVIKSPREIEAMRESGRRLTRLMRDLVGFTKPGVSAKDVDALAARKCKEYDLVSGAYNYGGGPKRFPGHICVSINEVIVHGIPGKQRIQEGDIVSLDVAVSHKGYFADMCVTIPIGEVTQERRQLMDVCRDALFAGIAEAQAGNRLTDISHAIEKHASAHGMQVVRDFVGHGIGRRMHEPPQVPHFGPPGRGPLLKPGMVICIEPQIVLGSPEVRFMPDGWTAVTVDGSLSAHFEHTVAITPDGPDVLTNWGIEE
jgi:methionyl aminopeptidase